MAVGVSCTGTCGTIIRTLDGGTTWTTQTIPTTPVNDPSHAPQAVLLDGTGMKGTVVGNHGLILTTTNSGTAWTLQAPSAFATGTYYFNAISYYKLPYTNSTVGVLVGWGAIIGRTTTSGSSWVNITNPYTGTGAQFFGVDLH